MKNNPGPRLVSKLFNIPLYIEINDLIVPTLAENGASPALVRKARKNQELDFRQSSGLVIPSVPRLNWINNKYNIPGDRIHLILNGTDEYEKKLSDRLQAKNRLGLTPNSFCLGFLGTLYERYDFKSILQVMFECQDIIAELSFIIVGDGPLRSKIAKKAIDFGLEKRIIFTGYVEQEKLSNIIPAFDIGLLILTKKHATIAGPVHTKLSTYAMYGLPIVTAGFSLKGYPERLVQGLYLVPPENPSAIAEKIIHIYNNPNERGEKAKILNDYAIEKLTWNAASAEILKIIENDKKFAKKYQ
jgi:colanic acid biosynthesis glycosyl transferase WcaI